MQQNKKPLYRYCIVPLCKNTSISAPNKMFFMVPRGVDIRKKWCTIMRRLMVSPTSSLYCCEDHFDLEKDTDNYIQYKIMNFQEEYKSSVRLKIGILPHKFHCQNNTTQQPEKQAYKNTEDLEPIEESGPAACAIPTTSEIFQGNFIVENNKRSLTLMAKSLKMTSSDDGETQHKFSRQSSTNESFYTNETKDIVSSEEDRRIKEFKILKQQQYRAKKRISILRKEVCITKSKINDKSDIAGPSIRKLVYNPPTQTTSLINESLIASCTVQKPTPLVYTQLYVMFNSEQTYKEYVQQNSLAHQEFQNEFYENEFGHVCDICDRLWFKKHITTLDNIDTTDNIEFIRTLLRDVTAVVKLCYSCLAICKTKSIPPMSVYNGFKYPPLTNELKNNPLGPLTERLVSPKVPFVQIGSLQQIDGQYEAYGPVINVPIEMNTLVRSLPRNIGADHNVTIDVDGKKLHKSSYVYSTVNRRKIKTWLTYLKDTPVYMAYGINVDTSFLNDMDDNGVDEDGDSGELSMEKLEPQQQTVLWNDDMYSSNNPGDHEEEMSFPQIYLGQFRHYREGVKVTPAMIVSSELRRSDRRGATPQHLLYMAMKLMRAKIRDSLVIAFKHIGLGNTIVSSIEETQLENHTQSCIESISTMLRTIPNSPYYWSEMRKDLFAMIRQYGRPTVSFTINANEFQWHNLLQLLYRLKNNRVITIEDVAALSSAEKNKLISEDAVTCTIYFNKLVNVLLKILQSKTSSPFEKYRVLHYFKKIEFGHNGSPRANILAWLDNAPKDVLDKDNNKAIELIDFLISVSASEAYKNIELQTHSHNCKCHQTTAAKNLSRCKSKAPFMPIKTTMILKPMKKNEAGYALYKIQYDAVRKRTIFENHHHIQNSSECDGDFQKFYKKNNIKTDEEYINILRAGISRPTVFLKREPWQQWHHPFNPFILNIVKSFTEFHYIPDDLSCAAFVAEYVDKSSRDVSDLRRKLIEIMREDPNINIFEITKNFSASLLNGTEMTSQEAAWYLLTEPTWKSSAKIAYIPTVWPAERHRMKEITSKLNELVDSDVKRDDWFDKYEKRPDELEDVTLAQFVSKYKMVKGKCVERDEPRVIRYRNYNKSVDLNEYKREMVTLHVPFRNSNLNEAMFIYDDNKDLILSRRKEFESDINIERSLNAYLELCQKDITDVDKCDRDDVHANGTRRKDKEISSQMRKMSTDDPAGDSDCKFYKSCAVPMCRSTSIKTPGKLFVFVPQRTGLRKEWFRLAKRVKPLRSQKTYFCEDHFDMPNDMLNYMQYHVTGSVSRIHMRPGCLPSRFDCQTDGQPADVCQPAAVKRQRDDEGARDDRTLTVECDNENDTTSCSDIKQERHQSTEVPRQDDSAGAASESGGCKKIKIEESQERMEADEESDVARLLHCEIEIKQEADSDDGV